MFRVHQEDFSPAKPLNFTARRKVDALSLPRKPPLRMTVRLTFERISIEAKMPAIKIKRTRTADKTTRKKSGARKSSPSLSTRKTAHRWVASVRTESTFPPEGLFTTDASTIARNLASKRTSPKGPSSGMRMLNYYINRAGHNLPASRKPS